MQSFFNSFRNKRLQGPRHDAKDKATAGVFNYIDPFYNRKRQHPTLGYVFPPNCLENWISTQHEQNLAA